MNNNTDTINLTVETQGETWTVSASSYAVSLWLETWEITPKEEI